MKKIRNIFLATLAIILLLVGGFSWMNYAPDKSLDELKATWTYDNSQFIDIDGMPVHYRINGEGEPLVLIHGTAASLHTWEEWTKILEKDFKVISMDIPAFGLTGPNPERDYTYDYYAEFLNTFLEKIGVGEFSVAGNSLGGAIAWRYTTMYPEKVKNLILLDAAGYPFKQDLPLAFRLAQNNLTAKFLLTVTPKSLFRTSLEEVYDNDDLVTDELIDRYYELYLRAGNRQAFVDRVNLIQEVDTSSIKTIKTPTLIIWGKTDEWIPVDNANKFARDIINSELKIYENVGHVPMEESPEITASDTRTFLLKNLEKAAQAQIEMPSVSQ